MGAVSAARSRARKAGLEFDLTLDWALEQFEKQQGRCAVTGVQFDFSAEPGDRETYFRPYAMSLDRREPSRGYTQDNVEVICMAMNLAFNQFGRVAFDELVERYLAKKREGLVTPPAQAV